MTGFLFNRLAVLGVGLVGGSLAAAAKERDGARSVVGFGRNPANLELALQNGVVDAATSDLIEAVTGADLVVLAGPVGTFTDTVRRIAPSLTPGCIVTDVGSVKGQLVREIEALLPAGVFFVGGHPIAGGSVSGVAHARGNLFQGARTVLTPTGRTSAEALSRVSDLWKRLGSEIVLMEPDDHDRLFASVSHLPHFVAYALVSSLSGERGRLESAGKGLLDTTRIAASPANIWTDIFRMNRECLLECVKHFEEAVAVYRQALERSDWDGLRSLLEESRDMRERLG